MSYIPTSCTLRTNTAQKTFFPPEVHRPAWHLLLTSGNDIVFISSGRDEYGVRNVKEQILRGVFVRMNKRGDLIEHLFWQVMGELLKSARAIIALLMAPTSFQQNKHDNRFGLFWISLLSIWLNGSSSCNPAVLNVCKLNPALCYLLRLKNTFILCSYNLA